MDRNTSLEIYRKAAFCRAFEEEAYARIQSKDIKLEKFEQIETTLINISEIYIPYGLLEKTGVLQAIINIRELKKEDD